MIKLYGDDAAIKAAIRADGFAILNDEGCATWKRVTSSSGFLASDDQTQQGLILALAGLLEAHVPAAQNVIKGLTVVAGSRFLPFLCDYFSQPDVKVFGENA